MNSETNNLQNYSHKRYNILTGEWILVSPHRSKRPWEGQEELIIKEKLLIHDKNCYLCSGNKRANGEVNSNYEDVYIFTNDFAALQSDSPSFSVNEKLFKAKSEHGICKVICYSSNHSKSLAQMEVGAIENVIKAWKKEYINLSKTENINYVQIFENKGRIMGCSNPHPHGQIWSQSIIPNEVVKKDKKQLEYYQINKSGLLADYLTEELRKKERIVFENDAFVILVPFWAIWPFETMIIPKKEQSSIMELFGSDYINFAEAISVITKVYDKLFDCSFPYSSGIHQAPTNNEDSKHWLWHMSFYPPLLRSATVKKFMVGYEMFGSPQRDITAESVANQLRKLV